jgi:hypothetical protein
VDVDADVPLLGSPGLARVHSHANPHRPVGERALGLVGGCDRVARARECEKERIALRVHLDASVPREDLAQHATVLGEHVSAFLATAFLAGIGAALALLLLGRPRAAAREQVELEPAPAPAGD